MSSPWARTISATNLENSQVSGLTHPGLTDCACYHKIYGDLILCVPHYLAQGIIKCDSFFYRSAYVAETKNI